MCDCGVVVGLIESCCLGGRAGSQQSSTGGESSGCSERSACSVPTQQHSLYIVPVASLDQDISSQVHKVYGCTTVWHGCCCCASGPCARGLCVWGAGLAWRKLAVRDRCCRPGCERPL